MDSWHRRIAESSALLEATGIPRRVLSRLMTAAGIGVGYSVLDVGCGRGELIGYLDSLGIQCVGIDESAENVMQARRNVSNCEFYRARVGDPLPSLNTEFDLVLVRDSSCYSQAMLSRSTLSATADLLSRLRQGGCLAFLSQTASTTATAERHRFACYARHVRAFPGTHQLHSIPDGLTMVEHVRSWMTGAEVAGFGIAIVRPPRETMSRSDWVRAGDGIAAGEPAPCCAWAAARNAVGERRSHARAA